MAVIRTEEDLLSELSPLVQGLGYSIVEVHSSHIRGTVHVNMAIYRPDGVTVEGCAEVSRTILPRMNILFDTQDIYLEVASPGIERKVKHVREYAIFNGKGVHIYLKSGAEIGGTIAGTDESSVTINTCDKELKILYTEIQKAKLDDTQEVK